MPLGRPAAETDFHTRDKPYRPVSTRWDVSGLAAPTANRKPFPFVSLRHHAWSKATSPPDRVLDCMV